MQGFYTNLKLLENHNLEMYIIELEWELKAAKEEKEKREKNGEIVNLTGTGT